METGLNTKKPSGLGVITAAECVSGSLDKLGYETETIGSWKHELLKVKLRVISSLMLFDTFQRGVAKMKKKYYVNNWVKIMEQQDDDQRAI